MARILIYSSGSLGDLHPFLLIGRRLVERGHSVRFLTLSAYKSVIESAGMTHFTCAPDFDPSDLDFAKKIIEPRNGTQFLFKEILLPNVREMHQRLSRAAEGVDLLISGSLAYDTTLLYESRGIPWISVGLQPAIFMSDHEFPVLAHAPWMRHPPFSCPIVNRLIRRTLRALIDASSGTWYQLRSELGLKERKNFVIDAGHSPQLQLAAYSPLFGARQRDWPDHRKHVGFIQPSKGASAEGGGLSPALERFLSSGEKPIVFTLGSAAVMIGKSFFEMAFQVLRQTKQRAVLVSGDLASELEPLAKELPDVLITGSEPYSALFSRCRAVIHQGGIGTTGEALRAGIPSGVIPFANDQYDNAFHIEKMRCGVWTPFQNLNEHKLKRLLFALDSKDLVGEAKRVGLRLAAENGLEEAVCSIETFIRSRDR